MARGILIAAFDFANAHADEFHDWYDLEHMPERQSIPGFGTCERWIGGEQATQSVATYDLDSVDVLRSEQLIRAAADRLADGPLELGTEVSVDPAAVFVEGIRERRPVGIAHRESQAEASLFRVRQPVGLLVTPFLQPVLHPPEERVSLAEFFDGLVRQHPAAA